MRAWLFIGMLSVSFVVQPVQKQQITATPDNHQREGKQGPRPDMSPGEAPSNGQETSKHDQCFPAKKTTDWHEAFAPPTWSNWFLGLVGVGAVAAGLLTLGAIRRQADIMERQTAVSEKTLVLAQRPRIYVRNLYFSEIRGTGAAYRNPNGIEGGSFCSGQFYIVNSGGTTAHIKEVYCEVLPAKHLPMMRPYEGKIGEQGTNKLEPGQSMTWLFALKESLDGLNARRISENNMGLYVLGWIGYTDDLGIYRITAFCREYSTHSDRFVPVDKLDYEHSD